MKYEIDYDTLAHARVSVSKGSLQAKLQLAGNGRPSSHRLVRRTLVLLACRQPQCCHCKRRSTNGREQDGASAKALSFNRLTFSERHDWCLAVQLGGGTLTAATQFCSVELGTSK